MSWIAIGVTAAGVVSGAMASKSAAKQSQTQNQYSKEDQELNFQRQAWLAQQQRAWQLQDRQFKAQSIAGFSKFGAPSGITPPNQDAELAGLNQFDPNKLGSIGKPVAPPAQGATGGQPQPLSPLGQLDPRAPIHAGGGVY